jgi:hypothetical protein
MATFTEEALKQKINDLNKMKTRELKELCTLLKVKKSNNGVSNKYVLRKNLLINWIEEFDLEIEETYNKYKEIWDTLEWE